MITISAGLRNALAADVSTLCRLITITLTTGRVLRYTTLDREITFGAQLYTPAGVDASAIRQSKIGGSNGGSITLIMGEDITEDMIRSRALSGALYRIEFIDYKRPDFGSGVLSVGKFGNIDFDERGQCTINLDSLITTGAARNIGEVYSQNCRNDFGDKLCRFDIESLRVPFVIDAVIDLQTFVANELITPTENKYLNGVVTFTSGDNLNTTMEVVYSATDGMIVLGLVPPYDIIPGDSASIIPGCTKERSVCKTLYNNLLNFKGEPDVPPIDQQQTPIANGTSAAPAPSTTVSIQPVDYVDMFARG